MFTEAFETFLYSSLFISLFIIDYILGNGLVDLFEKIICELICFIRKSIKEDAKQMNHLENTVSVTVIRSELLLLFLIILFLNRYKQFRCKDRIDDLLQESRDALRQINEFLEKWRVKRTNYKTKYDYSYLEDDPLKVAPMRLEVPILHMAIIDTMGTTRFQPERGDAGDTVNVTDSTLLSVTSLLDDDLDYLAEVPSDEKLDEKAIDLHKRYLWDVMEEDVCNLEN